MNVVNSLEAIIGLSPNFQDALFGIFLLAFGNADLFPICVILRRSGADCGDRAPLSAGDRHRLCFCPAADGIPALLPGHLACGQPHHCAPPVGPVQRHNDAAGGLCGHHSASSLQYRTSEGHPNSEGNLHHILNAVSAKCLAN